VKHARAISLLETVVCVLVLAVAVPPTLELLQSAGAERADSVNTTRAVLLATLVAETVIADASSPAEGLGPGAFGNAVSYLDAPGSGLRDRLASAAEPYVRVGMSWDVSVGPAIGPEGRPDPDPARNIFRAVEVRVDYPGSDGGLRSMPVTVVVGGEP
jgi:hypothetical protein